MYPSMSASSSPEMPSAYLRDASSGATAAPGCHAETSAIARSKPFALLMLSIVGFMGHLSSVLPCDQCVHQPDLRSPLRPEVCQEPLDLHLHVQAAHDPVDHS